MHQKLFGGCDWSGHRRRSSVNFRGHYISARKICMKNYQNARSLHNSCPKNYQNTRILWYLPEKLMKSPIFTSFLSKNAHILRINCPKNIFWGDSGTRATPAPPHSPMPIGLDSMENLQCSSRTPKHTPSFRPTLGEKEGERNKWREEKEGNGSFAGRSIF